MPFKREMANFGHPRAGGRKPGRGYSQSVPEPHKHVPPRGKRYTDPGNDRKCVPHNAGATVLCDVEGCEKALGRECRDCGRVV